MPKTGYFYLEENQIIVSAFHEESVTPYLLGRVLGLWLEMQGIPLLHGAALKINGQAIGLLGQSGMGKSTLSAAMVRDGFELLSDDLILLTPQDEKWPIEPGIQQLRIWPDSGKAFFDDFENHARVHPDYEKRKIQTKVSDSLPMATEKGYLRVLITLERCAEPTPTLPEWECLHGGEAMIQLIGNSYNVEALEALGWQKERLRKLAELCADIPIWRLRYASGFEHLPGIVQKLARRWG